MDAESDEGEYEEKECNDVMASDNEDSFTEHNRIDNRNASVNGNEEDKRQ